MQDKRASNREALLESALASLQDRGFADTTARDVAHGAGVSLGAIGYHFGSVQNLLDEALTDGVRRWFDPMIESLADSPPALDQLGPALDGFFETLDQNRPLVIPYFEALVRAERSPDLRAALAADFQTLRATLTNGIEQSLSAVPEAHSPEPEVAASLIMAVFDGLIIQWLLDPQKLPSTRSIAETLLRAATLASVPQPSTTAG